VSVVWRPSRPCAFWSSRASACKSLSNVTIAGTGRHGRQVSAEVSKLVARRGGHRDQPRSRSIVCIASRCYRFDSRVRIERDRKELSCQCDRCSGSRRRTNVFVGGLELTARQTADLYSGWRLPPNPGSPCTSQQPGERSSTACRSTCSPRAAKPISPAGGHAYSAARARTTRTE
jgi:hypothetical protein